MKVFQLNDCDWYLAPTLDAAVQACTRETGLDRDEILNREAHELSAAELQRFVFRDDDGSRRPFAEQLARELARDATTIRIFASTEV